MMLEKATNLQIFRMSALILDMPRAAEDNFDGVNLARFARDEICGRTRGQGLRC